jgi:hypothetical protein
MKSVGRLALGLVLLAGGCAAPRMPTTPLLARANPYDTENEIVLQTDQAGPEAYALLFERVLDVLDDDFDIAFASRYDGRIECKPKIAPGLERPFVAGSPSVVERALATFQTYRHRCFVLIQPVEHGYQINVTVMLELEDLPHPTRDVMGGAAFRGDADVDRRLETIDPAVVSHVWIPRGRDVPMEQKILRKIKWRINEPD